VYGKQLGWLGDREGGRREPLRRTRTAAVNTRRPPSRAAHEGGSPPVTSKCRRNMAPDAPRQRRLKKRPVRVLVLGGFRLLPARTRLVAPKHLEAVRGLASWI
jgi:hypothetical protein